MTSYGYPIDRVCSRNKEAEDVKLSSQKNNSVIISDSIERWLLPTRSQRKSTPRKSGRLSMSYVKNNIVFLTFMACYFAVNVVLFATRAAEFWRIELPDGTVVYGDYLYMLARGSGQFRAQLGHFVSVTDSIPHEGRALHFNGMFILVLMLRRSITFLRSKGFANFLPLDQHVYLHKMVGVAILGLSIFHSIMHVCHFGE